MAQLQFLSGPRDQERVDLNPSASLVIGRGEGAHIDLGEDEAAEPQHAAIYPADGAFWLQDLGAGITIVDLKRLASTTAQLHDRDVFIVGGTYLKLWLEDASP